MVYNQRKEVMENLIQKNIVVFIVFEMDQIFKELIDGKRKDFTKVSEYDRFIKKKSLISKKKLKTYLLRIFQNRSFENSYLDSLKFLILLNEIEKNLKLKFNLITKQTSGLEL